MNEEQVETRFLRDVASHELTIEVDDGAHRHLTLRRHNSFAYGFHIVTWPGSLAISGDMGSFVFSRLYDMFEFFRGTRINTGYWAEKLTAHDRHGGHRKFSKDLFRDAIIRDFEQWAFEAPEDRVRAKAELDNEWNGLLGATPDTIQEAVRDAMEYECPVSKNRFVDFWDHNLEEYTFQFVWCCHAIQWAIGRYDSEKELRTRCLTPAEQKAQAERCGCCGADDLCPCQNVPDAQTITARRASLSAVQP